MKEQLYEMITKEQYQRLLCGEYQWGVDIENLKKLVNFSQAEINLVESIGFDVERSEIISQNANQTHLDDNLEPDEDEIFDQDFSGPFARANRTAIQMEEVELKRESISIYERNVITPIFIVIKIEDEYFIVVKIITSDDRYESHNKYYKCDQIDGFIECLKQNRNVS